MSTQLDRYKFEAELERVILATLEGKGMTQIAITGDDDELQDLSVDVTVSIAGARSDVSVQVLTGDNGAHYREPIFYDAFVVVRLVVPEVDEYLNPVDWAAQVATVRESIREYYLEDINALLPMHEIVDILPTGTERTTFENRKAFTFSFAVIFNIKESAFAAE